MKFFLDAATGDGIPLHMGPAARMDAHTGTLSLKAFEQLFRHPLTGRGLEGFLKDWEEARETLGNVFGPAVVRSSKR